MRHLKEHRGTQIPVFKTKPLHSPPGGSTRLTSRKRFMTKTLRTERLKKLGFRPEEISGPHGTGMTRKDYFKLIIASFEGADTVRFKAEVNFDGREITKRHLSRKDLPQLVKVNILLFFCK